MQRTASSIPIESALIVGGGIAGLGAAIALGKRGVLTTVLERADGAIGASIAITERAIYALQELGILDQAVQQGSPLSQDDQVSRSVYSADGTRLFQSSIVHGEEWTLPVSVRIYRPLLAEIMRTAARQHGAELLMGHSYRSLEALTDHVEAELTTGERRSFDLLVGADGVHSELRTRFFPEAGEPHYTGSMSFRAMFENAPANWREGMYVANGNTIMAVMLPRRLLYLALPNHMERRRIEQAEAREIMRTVLREYQPSKMFEQISERLTGDVPVLVAPYEWILVEPPWHRGRVVLVGDAVHATAPTIGSAGGMALEDGVVLAQELAGATELEAGLCAYAERRRHRAKLVVETSALLMHTHQQHRPVDEEQQLRMGALQQLVAPY